jgi:hypothetical protein
VAASVTPEVGSCSGSAGQYEHNRADEQGQQHSGQKDAGQVARAKQARAVRWGADAAVAERTDLKVGQIAPATA